MQLSLRSWGRPVLLGELALSLTFPLFSPASFCTPNIFELLLPWTGACRILAQEASGKLFPPLFHQRIGSLDLLTHLEPTSWMLSEGCEAILPPSPSDTLLEVPLTTRKNFPGLLAVAWCSLVCPGLCLWLVSSEPLIWSCSFISLSLEAVLETALSCPDSITSARQVMRPVAWHQCVCIQISQIFLCFRRHLNHTLQNEGSLEGPVPSSASPLDPGLASSSMGCWRCESLAPGQYFSCLFPLLFPSWDMSFWLYSLAIWRQQSTVVV